jgi:hypothetical protein
MIFGQSNTLFILQEPDPFCLNSTKTQDATTTFEMGKPETMRVRGVDASDCLDFSGETVYGDFRDALVKDGFVVIKAIDPKKAAEHADNFHNYMEGL